MPRSQEVDAYIAAAAPFAQPILQHLRELVHRTCPDASEAMKWRMPFFTLHGRILANMAAHKAHASFGLSYADAVLGGAAAKDGMGHFGKLRSLADLPPDEKIAATLRKAAELCANPPPGRRPATKRPG